MGVEEKKSKLQIAGVIALYWFVSISLVYINKFIVSRQADPSDGAEKKPSVPIFITWSQVCRLRQRKGRGVDGNHGTLTSSLVWGGTVVSQGCGVVLCCSTRAAFGAGACCSFRSEGGKQLQRLVYTAVSESNSSSLTPALSVPPIDRKLVSTPICSAS